LKSKSNTEPAVTASAQQKKSNANGRTLMSLAVLLGGHLGTMRSSIRDLRHTFVAAINDIGDTIDELNQTIGSQSSVAMMPAVDALAFATSDTVLKKIDTLPVVSYVARKVVEERSVLGQVVTTMKMLDDKAGVPHSNVVDTMHAKRNPAFRTLNEQIAEAQRSNDSRHDRMEGLRRDGEALLDISRAIGEDRLRRLYSAQNPMVTKLRRGGPAPVLTMQEIPDDCDIVPLIVEAVKNLAEQDAALQPSMVVLNLKERKSLKVERPRAASVFGTTSSVGAGRAVSPRRCVSSTAHLTDPGARADVFVDSPLRSPHTRGDVPEASPAMSLPSIGGTRVSHDLDASNQRRYVSPSRSRVNDYVLDTRPGGGASNQQLGALFAKRQREALLREQHMKMSQHSNGAEHTADFVDHQQLLKGASTSELHERSIKTTQDAMSLKSVLTTQVLQHRVRVVQHGVAIMGHAGNALRSELRHNVRDQTLMLRPTTMNTAASINSSSAEGSGINGMIGVGMQTSVVSTEKTHPANRQMERRMRHSDDHVIDEERSDNRQRMLLKGVDVPRSNAPVVVKKHIDDL
jgi:hypothetical protein